MREKFYALIPNVLFFVGVISLFFSGLNFEKAIVLESHAFSKFLKDLEERDFFFALAEILKTIFYEAIIPLLPFLFLTTLGFSLILLLKKEIDFNTFMFIQAIFFSLAIFLKPSLLLIFIYLGIIITSFSMRKLEEKINFSSGFSLSQNSMKWLSIFVSIGFFLSLQLNLNNYYNLIYKSNMDFIKNMVPDVENLIKYQRIEASRFINETTEGIKNGLSNAYSKLDQNQRETCGFVYTSLVKAIDDYKIEANKKLYEKTESEEKRIEEYVEQIVPFDQLIKITPLLLSLLLFTLLEIIRPFLSLIFGLIFFLIEKAKT